MDMNQNAGMREELNQSLLLFSDAKIVSIGIFKKLQCVIKSFLSLHDGLDKVLATDDSFLKQADEKCIRISEIIERNNMKCAFFGRTSNGKSTVINAMLGKKILPCGIGHTTNCFVQVQGTSGAQGYIIKNDEGDEEGKSLPVHSISELGHAFSEERLSNDSIIYLYWPQVDCPLLKSEVTILDSPGVDIDPNVDFWIDKYCLDADIFVLVSNSESTLSNTEKKFFLKVREKISNPHIYILNNRWDLCELEEEAQNKETKAQHQRRCIDFLSKELKVMSESDAVNYIFFISAKEVLDFKIKGNEITGDNSKVKERINDFFEFEKSLEKTLCMRALKTKFAAHTKQGLELVDKIVDMVTKFDAVLNNNVRQYTTDKLDLTNRLKSIKKGMNELNTTVNNKINVALDNISVTLSNKFQEEVKQMHSILKDFRGDFSTESTRLLVYKTEINNHLENELNFRLSSLGYNIVQKEIRKFREELLEEFGILLQSNLWDNKLIKSIVNPNSPNISGSELHIPCNSLLSTFKEDLEFRWPLSIGKIVFCLFKNFPFQGALHRISGNTQQFAINQPSNNKDCTMWNQALDFVYNRQFFMFITSTGLMYKGFGFRLLTSAVCSYGMLYLFERYQWSGSTQEHIFKKQYTKYATVQLTNFSEICIRNSTHMVKQEMLMNTRSLIKHVESENEKLEINLKDREKEIKMSSECLNTLSKLKKSVFEVQKDLKHFINMYLV